MAPSTPNMFHSLQVFSIKLPSSSSSSSSSKSSTLSSNMKIKNLIHTLIFTHLSRITRALCKAKSLIIETLKENQPSFIHSMKKKFNKKNKNRIFFGSFRLHYNWCSTRYSSHVMPVSSSVFEGHLQYYDSTWNSTIQTDQAVHDHNDADNPQLSGYLQWLEEKKVRENYSNSDHHHHQPHGDINEIDKLAEMFIANCHEKFRLEKQESYRKFQELLARSM